MSEELVTVERSTATGETTMKVVTESEAAEMAVDGWTVRESDPDKVIVGAPMRGKIYKSVDFTKQFYTPQEIREGKRYIIEGNDAGRRQLAADLANRYQAPVLVD